MWGFNRCRCGRVRRRTTARRRPCSKRGGGGAARMDHSRARPARRVGGMGSTGLGGWVACGPCLCLRPGSRGRGCRRPAPRRCGMIDTNVERARVDAGHVVPHTDESYTAEVAAEGQYESGRKRRRKKGNKERDRRRRPLPDPMNVCATTCPRYAAECSGMACAHWSDAWRLGDGAKYV